MVSWSGNTAQVRADRTTYISQVGDCLHMLMNRKQNVLEKKILEFGSRPRATFGFFLVRYLVALCHATDALPLDFCALGLGSSPPEHTELGCFVLTPCAPSRAVFTATSCVFVPLSCATFTAPSAIAQDGRARVQCWPSSWAFSSTPGPASRRGACRGACAQLVTAGQQRSARRYSAAPPTCDAWPLQVLQACALQLARHSWSHISSHGLTQAFLLPRVCKCAPHVYRMGSNYSLVAVLATRCMRQAVQERTRAAVLEHAGARDCLQPVAGPWTARCALCFSTVTPRALPCNWFTP